MGEVVMAYHNFAQFYDRVEADAPHAFSRWILDRVNAQQAQIASVLELGCGTGAVLQALPRDWSKTGIDVSRDMLDQALLAGIDAKLVEADMTTAVLHEQFDLVICVFDTINHLLDPDDWRRAFRVAHEHLHAGGLFLFDVNTIGRLRELAGNPTFVRDFDDNTILIKVHESRPALFEWDIRVFEAKEGHYLLHREVISETSLPLSEIHELLRAESFDVIEARDGEGADANDDSKRTFFVCRAT